MAIEERERLARMADSEERAALRFAECDEEPYPGARADGLKEAADWRKIAAHLRAGTSVPPEPNDGATSDAS